MQNKNIFTASLLLALLSLSIVSMGNSITFGNSDDEQEQPTKVGSVRICVDPRYIRREGDGGTDDHLVKLFEITRKLNSSSMKSNAEEGYYLLVLRRLVAVDIIHALCQELPGYQKLNDIEGNIVYIARQLKAQSRPIIQAK